MLFFKLFDPKFKNVKALVHVFLIFWPKIQKIVKGSIYAYSIFWTKIGKNVKELANAFF